MEAQQQQQDKEKLMKKVLWIEELKPYANCIFCSICFAGYNIISKVSLDNGMSTYVLAVYGHFLGTLTTALLAFLFERKNDAKIRRVILRDIFFLGLLGAVVGMTLHYAGLKSTSPTATSALANLIPSMRFLLAFLCRMESLDIWKRSAQAKVAGTFVALAGATLTTLYKGGVVISPHSDQHHQHRTSKLQLNKDWIKGSFLLLVSYTSLSAFLVLQTLTVKKYPAPITLTSLTCLSGTLLSAIMASVLIINHHAGHCPGTSASLLSFIGIVIYGLIFYLQALVGRTKGAVFMTAFRPLGTVITAVMAILILEDALFLGREKKKRRKRN